MLPISLSIERRRRLLLNRSAPLLPFSSAEAEKPTGSPNLTRSSDLRESSGRRGRRPERSRNLEAEREKEKRERAQKSKPMRRGSRNSPMPPTLYRSGTGIGIGIGIGAGEICSRYPRPEFSDLRLLQRPIARVRRGEEEQGKAKKVLKGKKRKENLREQDFPPFFSLPIFSRNVSGALGIRTGELTETRLLLEDERKGRTEHRHE